MPFIPSAIVEYWANPAPSGTRRAVGERGVEPLRSLESRGVWQAWWNRPVDEPSVAGAHRARPVGIRWRLVPRH